MCWQTVQKMAGVGAMLIELKEKTPHREFHSRVNEIGISQPTSSRFMQLASNLPLLGQHKPESQRAALALYSVARRIGAIGMPPTYQRKPRNAL